MHKNAEIKDVICKIDYFFEWNGKVKEPLFDTFSSNYKSMYGDWYITEEKAKKYINKSNHLQIIKQKHIEQNEINKTRKYKDISSNIYIEATLYYKLSYIDGESLWASETIKITENNYYSKLLSHIHLKDVEVYAEVTDDDICVIFDDSDTILKPVDEPIQNMNDKEKFIIQYLSVPNKWVDCNINEIKTNNTSISIPILINESSIEFEFSNPQDNKSDIWNFANEFNYDDPWNLQNEDAQISIRMIANNSYYQNGFWNIRKPKSQRLTGIKSKIRKILS